MNLNYLLETKKHLEEILYFLVKCSSTIKFPIKGNRAFSTSNVQLYADQFHKVILKYKKKENFNIRFVEFVALSECKKLYIYCS